MVQLYNFSTLNSTKCTKFSSVSFVLFEYHVTTIVRNTAVQSIDLFLPAGTVSSGGTKFYLSGLDLSTLEVRSVRTSHSGLSKTGRRKLEPAVKTPKFGVFLHTRVPISTQVTFLLYIKHTVGPSPYILYGQDLYVTFHDFLQKSREVLLQKRAT